MWLTWGNICVSIKNNQKTSDLFGKKCNGVTKMQNKTERFIHANIGEHSAFMEMLKHLCEHPDEAIERNVPERMLNQLEYVLAKCNGVTK